MATSGHTSGHTPGQRRTIDRMAPPEFDHGRLDEATWRRAHTEAESSGLPLAVVLGRNGLTGSEASLAAAAHALGISWTRLPRLTPRPDAIRTIPEELARRHRMLPLGREHGKLLVAMADMKYIVGLESLSRKVGQPLTACLVDADELDQALDRFYQGAPRSKSTSARDDVEMVAAAVEGLINTAVAEKASHLHLVAVPGGSKVSLRIDGVVHEQPAPTMVTHAAMVARLKSLARIRVGDSRHPKTASFPFVSEAGRVMVKLSYVPTHEGDCITLRVTSPAQRPRGLKTLGLLAAEGRQLTSMIRSASGLLLATGPSGSGRSTLLYSMIDCMRGTRVLTIEQAPSYHVEGAEQIALDDDVGYSQALTGAIEHDPDVILCDELDSKETALLAVKAALNGKFVLVTAPMPDTVSAVGWLLELGVPPIQLAAALRGVVATRLVPTGVPAEDANDRATARTGIFEVLTNTPVIAGLIRVARPISDLQDAAAREGSRALLDTGLELAGHGKVNVEDVIRIAGARPVSPRPLVPLGVPTDAGGAGSLRGARNKPRPKPKPQPQAVPKKTTLMPTASGLLDPLSMAPAAEVSHVGSDSSPGMERPTPPPWLAPMPPVRDVAHEEDERQEQERREEYTGETDDAEEDTGKKFTARLVVLNGPSRGLSARIVEGCTYTLGRDDGADIAVPDRYASKHNTLVKCLDGQVSVEDLQSSNGTKINGRGVERGLLSVGDELQVGCTKLVVAPEHDPTSESGMNPALAGAS